MKEKQDRLHLNRPEPTERRVAIIHYWLTRIRGGEAVLRELIQLNPSAAVFTNVFDAEGVGDLFHERPHPTCTSINRLPFARTLYPLYMPLMPGALERLDLANYDLVISSEAGPAKWVIPAPDAWHICYMHSPMRYLWDQRFLYRNRLPWPATLAFDVVTSRLRDRDVISSSRVDTFVANSSFVARRIQRYYNREAAVIHPPVQLDDLTPGQEAEDFYLLAGQLVSYKNSLTAVEACIRLGRKLLVVGDGPDLARIVGLRSPLIECVGRVSREHLVRYMATCKALLFPGVEDFGIVPVEVMGSGRPIIAVDRGGVRDSIQDGKTGVLYQGSDTSSLVRAILRFEEWERDFDSAISLARAQYFSSAQFRWKWQELVLGLGK